MKQVAMWSRWGAEIEGVELDLKNFVNKINGSIAGPDDFFAHFINDNIVVLRCGSWNTADAQQILDLVGGDLSLFRSCIDLLDGCGPLEVGTIFEFAEDNSIINQQRSTRIPIRVAKEPKDWASPAAFRSVVDATSSSRDFLAAVVDFSTNPTWYDLYKSLEGSWRALGDEERLMLAFPGNNGLIRRIKRTAQSFRHTKYKFKPDPDPVSLDEAVGVVRDIVLGTAHKLQARAFRHASPQEPTSYVISNLSFDPGDTIGLRALSLGPPTVEEDQVPPLGDDAERVG